MVILHGIKNCDTIKKRVGGWKATRLTINSMTTAQMGLMQK